MIGCSTDNRLMHGDWSIDTQHKRMDSSSKGLNTIYNLCNTFWSTAETIVAAFIKQLVQTTNTFVTSLDLSDCYPQLKLYMNYEWNIAKTIVKLEPF